eukprot:5183183-Prymnesium_polylepis.2
MLLFRPPRKSSLQACEVGRAFRRAGGDHDGNVRAVGGVFAARRGRSQLGLKLVVAKHASVDAAGEEQLVVGKSATEEAEEGGEEEGGLSAQHDW